MDSTPQEADEVRSDLRTLLSEQGRGLNVVGVDLDEAGTPHVTVHPRHDAVSLAGCERFVETLVVTVGIAHRPRNLRFAGLDVANLTLALQANEASEVVFLQGTGRVTLADNVHPVTIDRVEGLQQLSIAAGGAMIAVAEANCEVLVDGGTFAPEGGVERVRFRSGELVTNRASSLFELIIDGAPSLTVGSNTPKLIAKVTGANAESSLKLNPDSDRSSSDPTLVVGEIRDLKVVLSARHLTLEVIKEARNLVIHGPGTIALGAGAAGDNVLITKAGLACGAEASLSNLSGNLHLSTCQGAQLAGGLDGFLILGDRRPDRRSQEPADWSESILTGFRLPHGLAGRRLVSKLTACYHVNPSTQDVPGWSSSFRLRHLGSWLQGLRKANDSSVGLDAEFVRELARVAKERGAPGPARTKLGWCSYRLRHQGSSGVEWLGLAGYRMLGYGERPLPALTTWLVLSLGLTGVALVTTSNGFGPTFGAMSLGPLAGLMRVGGSDATELGAAPWLVIRALLALPLITGLLALRNYVKGD